MQERFGKFGMKYFVMNNDVKEIREELIRTISNVSEEKLKEIEMLVKEILADNEISIEHIYLAAKRKYGNTLQKLAQ